MLIRIVKLTFKEDKITDFIENFNENKHKIRSFDGNLKLELYQDKTTPCIFFTYSYWQSETHLENYRQSEVFKKIWTYTKTLFNDKPEAWSVNKITEVTSEIK